VRIHAFETLKEKKRIKKMKAYVLILFVVLSGCVQRDPINRIVKKESDNHYFKSGPISPVYLPSNAPIAEVITQAFSNAFPFRIYANNVNVITQRNVSLAGQTFIAVLVKTESGEKVVFLQYDVNHWWHRVYDVKK
jgi:hypothetical protein